MPDYASPEDEKFFGAIGRLTISWAHLEFGLDAMVEVMHCGFGGKNNEGEIPRELSRKIRYLRSAFKRLPIPQDALESYCPFSRQLRRNLRPATTLFTASLSHIPKEVAKPLWFVRFERRMECKRKLHKTTADILSAAVRAQKLSGKVLYWVTQFQDLIRELARQSDKQRPL